MGSELIEKVMQAARDHEFECVGYAPTSKLVVRPEVRDMCAADKCHSYDRNWTCPPACGDIEFFQDEIDKRDHCVVFQSVGQMEDDFDLDVMFDTAEDHKDRIPDFIKEVREYVDDPLFLLMGACTICDECAYPDEPCRFPDLAMPSMEAAGLVVSDVCKAADIPYNHGPQTIAYSSCVLF